MRRSQPLSPALPGLLAAARSANTLLRRYDTECDRDGLALPCDDDPPLGMCPSSPHTPSSSTMPATAYSDISLDPAVFTPGPPTSRPAEVGRCFNDLRRASGTTAWTCRQHLE